MRRANLAVILKVLLVSIVAFIAGCSSKIKSDERVDSEPDFTGFVTVIEPGDSKFVSGRITIESHADKLVRKVIVTVRMDTPVYKQEGTEIKPVDFETLQLQDQVQVWFAGPVQEGFPAHATAQQVVIVGHY